MKWSISRTRRGQQALDYLIVVALIAIAVIGAVSIFGQDIREIFSSSTAAKAGDESSHAATNQTSKQ